MFKLPTHNILALVLLRHQPIVAVHRLPQPNSLQMTGRDAHLLAAPKVLPDGDFGSAVVGRGRRLDVVVAVDVAVAEEGVAEAFLYTTPQPINILLPRSFSIQGGRRNNSTHNSIIPLARLGGIVLGRAAPGVRLFAVDAVHVGRHLGVGPGAASRGGDERVRVLVLAGEDGAVVLGEDAVRVEAADAVLGRGGHEGGAVEDEDAALADEVFDYVGCV